MRKVLVLAVVVAFTLCSRSTTASAATVFLDTFELATYSSPPVEEDINDELLGGRQPFGASSYTEAGAAFIQDDNVPPPIDDALVLRTSANANASASSADLDADFGADLAGKKYRVSYDVQVDHAPGIAADNWQAFAIGDTSADGPNGASADFGILLRLDGGWQAFLDGAAVANGGGSGIVPGLPYSIDFDFDETIASPTVTATVNATLGAVVLGTLPIDALNPGTAFESGGRFFELKVFQGANGALLDTRLDNFQIEVIPEPASLALLTLASISCLAIRRKR